jgi:ABC-2 type transport system permease protein
MMSTLAGTPRLLRLALRRDRVVVPAWIVGLGCFVGFTTAMFDRSLASPADLVRETQLVTTSAGMRMLGIVPSPTVGGYMLHRELVTLAVLAALISVLTVVRHTRQDEELGRAEMLGSAVVGRFAPLAAAVVTAVLANLGLAVALTLGIVVAGQPVGGAALSGASVAGVGLTFTGVAAISCQLASTTRGATGTAAAVLGIAFLLSGVGNVLGTVDSSGLRVASAWPVWLSPIGWAQQTLPFGAGRVWPLGLFVACFSVLVAIAALLCARRDVARGLWAEPSGPERAPARLLSPAGLVWRLQRGVVLGWAVALGGFGAVFGTLSDQVEGLTGSAAEWYLHTGGSDVVLDAYRASMVGMAGMFVAIYTVQVLQRMRTDEAGGTLEALLATGVTRRAWLAAHVLVTVAGAVALLLLFAATMGWTTGIVLGDPAQQVADLLPIGLAQLPGILVVVGLVVALVGVAPRWSGVLSWVLLAGFLVVGPMFGPALGLPQWLQDVSPFTHGPTLANGFVDGAAGAVLLAVAVTSAALGALATTRRSLHLPDPGRRRECRRCP